ncbi:diaminopimelate decarboxylase [Thiospirochaeta perfilievii]|uniref:Diaminopimelate decarboxylase n=1 Tax=Thiospirochaeta perfilievii TaxID=252967 RepID=A0A5C1QCT9_9SPIO|nr:diaminopimelate decarboxylase [Thiospirochaeta perfilievii]QEN05371.1 diaminopimelate decarboxylase [Thiospirochaeta perfilievii]
MKISEISSRFTTDQDRLNFSGVDLDPIVTELGTPLFIYDAETIKDKYNYLRDNLPSQVDIFYAMKANSNIAIIKLLTSLGAGIEVASEGELYACKKAGVNPRNIVFGGPSKTDSDIETAIDMGIYALNAESLGEIRRINRIATTKGVVMDVELRINPEFEIAGVAVSLGGGSKKFGMDTEQLDTIIKEVLTFKGVRLQGIHIFAGTGINNSEGFLSNLENCFRIAKELNDNFFKVESIDVGGGIGIPYNNSDPEFIIDGLKGKISNLIKQYPFIKENGTRIITEPGRYLVGQSGVYITQVVDRKISRGREYLLVDGGAQHLLRPALIGVSQPTYNMSKLSSSDSKKYDVGGSLCTSIDFLGKDIDLPVDSDIDDNIAVFCSGAYGYNESMPFFLSHDIAPEVLIYNGKYHIIRPRIKIRDMVDIQSIPKDL